MMRLTFTLVAMCLSLWLSGQVPDSCDMPLLDYDQVLQLDPIKDHNDSLILCSLNTLGSKITGKEKKANIAAVAKKFYRHKYATHKYRLSINYIDIAIDIWRQVDDLDQYTYGLWRRGTSHYRLADFYQSYSDNVTALTFAKQAGNLNYQARVNEKISWTLTKVGQYKTAMNHLEEYRKLLPLLEKQLSHSWYYWNSMANVYGEMGDHEQARICSDSCLAYSYKFGDKNKISAALSNLSQYYIIPEELEERTTLLHRAIDISIGLKNQRGMALAYRQLGITYRKAVQYDSSLYYFKKCLPYLIQVEDKSRTHSVYNEMSEIYKEKKEWRLANEYLYKYESLREEIYNIDQIKKVFDLEKSNAINKANQLITSLEADKKEKELALRKQQINYLITSLVFLSIIAIIGFILIRLRNNQRLEKLKLKQQTEIKIQELQRVALRSQMNPHFIFNSLNSIKSYIANSEARKATRYLNKFSKLIRLILTNSNNKFITLDEELKALELYIQLEQLRLEESFEFQIDVDSNININESKIPPLIIQPFVENAIWHGLVHKRGEKKLDITVNLVEDKLMITITDNGIGRKASSAMTQSRNKDYKSFGMSITKERLFAGESSSKNVEIKDLENKQGQSLGTSIILTLPYLSDYE